MGVMMTKICKDCTHGLGLRNPFPFPYPLGFGIIKPSCCRPVLAAPIDLVTGKPKRLDVDPYSERKPGKTIFGRERCGPEAKFFEQYVAPYPPACEPPRPSR